MEIQMLHPAVFLSAMPVLHAFGYFNDDTGLEFDGRFIPLLVPSTAGDTDQNLHGTVMNVPIIAASGCEGHVVVTATQVCQVTLTGEILGVCIVGLSERESQVFDIVD